jgi:hypothetical protein
MDIIKLIAHLFLSVDRPQGKEPAGVRIEAQLPLGRKVDHLTFTSA